MIIILKVFNNEMKSIWKILRIFANEVKIKTLPKNNIQNCNKINYKTIFYKKSI